MLGQIPSWLNPPDFIGAMTRGAQIGLQQRREDLLQAQTADRLKFAYEQLGAKERMAAAGLQAANQRARAALELRGMQLDALRDYRQKQEQHAADVLKETARGHDLLEANRIATLKAADRTATERERHNRAMEGKTSGKSAADLLRDREASVLVAHINDLQRKLSGGGIAPDKIPDLQQGILNTQLRLKQLYRTTGKPSGPPSVTHTYNPNTGLSPVDTGSAGNAAADLQGDEDEEE